MYGTVEGISTVVASGVVAGAGVTLLPKTSGNMLGTILAVAAIAIGVSALVSQLIVRLVRRHYS